MTWPNLYVLSSDPLDINRAMTDIMATQLSSIPGQVKDSTQITYTTRTANTVFAAPDGSNGTPAFRALTATDIPNLDASKITTGTVGAARLPTATTSAQGIVQLAVVNGAPIIVYSNSWLNQSASIGLTTIYTSGASSDFIATVYVSATGALGTGNVTATLGWNDGDVSTNQSCSCSLAGAPLLGSMIVPLHSKATGTISIATTYTATGTYKLFVNLVRLS